ncbi:uncharacterized protein LOC141633788 [Silene latifolia]|uniref:uncharacterized protein LOC141633788 n=1 Tax=Silene latifolia TaxID=37657 RepID=UPI003D76F7DE
MKSKASSFVKNIMSVLSTLVKGKITGVKSKAQAMRVRFLVFSLLKSKKLSLVTITNKIQALLHKNYETQEIDPETETKAIILYEGGLPNESSLNTEYYDQHYYIEYNDDNYDDKYPDLTHSLFEEEEDTEGLDEGGSIIDMVKNSKENDGQDFKLEDEIDHAADLFIKRFKRQMRLQKLESFKRLQEMIGRTA